MNTEKLEEWFNNAPHDMYDVHWKALVAIVSNMVADEREACARIADLHRDPEHGTCGSQCLDYCCHEQIAKNIRARGSDVVGMG